MGIAVKLETERGDALTSIEDPQNLLHHALPAQGTPGFQWASTIDWYGDTTFNRAQAALLRAEWAILIEKASDDDAKKLLEQIDDMLVKCASEPHLYVKFYGD